MNRNDKTDIFATLRIPATPEGVKQRVLNAASEALEKPVRPTLWDVAWGNRLLRSTWALATTGLIVANISISFPASSPQLTKTVTARGQFENLRNELDLPSIVVGPRAEALVMGPRPISTNETESRDDARDNEVQL
jgi:hypothetical protein